MFHGTAEDYSVAGVAGGLIALHKLTGMSGGSAGVLQARLWYRSHPLIRAAVPGRL